VFFIQTKTKIIATYRYSLPKFGCGFVFYHEIKQETALSEDDIRSLVVQLKAQGLDGEYIESLLKTEIFKNNQEILK
jgi:hypothetical protein